MKEPDIGHSSRRWYATNVRDPIGTLSYASEYKSHLYIVGKSLAYTSINFKNSKDELVARGSHTKYVSNVILDALASCERLLTAQ